MEKELNTITDEGKIIAHHSYIGHWFENGKWLVAWNKELKEEEKENYKKEIQEMANRNKINVEFGEEK